MSHPKMHEGQATLSRKPIVASIIALSAAACVGIYASFLPAKHPANLTVLPSTNDFGKTDPGVLACTYKLVNDYDYPITLVGAYKSCSCTNVSLDKTLLQPGQGASLLCTFDVRGHSGPFTAIITVMYHKKGVTDKPPGVVECVAQANVDPIVHIVPDSLVFDKACTQVLSVSFRDGHSHLTSVESDEPGLIISSVKDGRAIINVKYVPELWKGGAMRKTADINIRTDCPHEERIRVPVTVSLVSEARREGNGL